MVTLPSMEEYPSAKAVQIVPVPAELVAQEAHHLSHFIMSPLESAATANSAPKAWHELPTKVKPLEHWRQLVEERQASQLLMHLAHTELETKYPGLQVRGPESAQVRLFVSVHGMQVPLMSAVEGGQRHAPEFEIVNVGGQRIRQAPLERV